VQDDFQFTFLVHFQYREKYKSRIPEKLMKILSEMKLPDLVEMRKEFGVPEES
jgi:hypothetical protein